jgi:NAD(P)-dependent dehydrogenase (short-subunit alcohol dehydrogenase family)
MASAAASLPLAGQIALVTGASRGIGAAIAASLHAAGAELLLAARGLEALRERAAELSAAGAVAQALELDVGDPAALTAAVSRLPALLGGRPVSILVNNAGIALSAPFERSGAGPEGDLFERHLAVNFHGPRRLAAALLPGLLERRGAVINVASSAGLEGYAYVSAYCASKHALVGWTRALAAELGPKGLKVSAVCPHYVESPLLEASIANVRAKTGQSEAQARDFFARQNPGQRLIQPAEVAVAVLDLCLAPRGGRILELDGARRIERGAVP